ncbi:nitroreductase [Desulfovibrio sp. X2]|uniref:nitroreductase family protein n=1 Tax=Desulfovibrio sp. X2 TaxID=941449 RepID=UPI000358815F|nr:nitroreductase family protein [Desulfovibrio sp. X2]EPR44747.1 nitroreductase [Desulfovibrio sp. X2]
MEILDALHTRRSIRKFTADPVAPEDIRTMLEAAMMAPSAGNAQPWQFILVDDRSLLSKVPSFSPYAAMAAHAPLGVLVCGDLSLEKYPGYWVQDCSAAMQNLLLAAHGLGYGAVWTGVTPMPDRIRGFRELLSLPPHVIPLGFAVVGRPDQQPKQPERFDLAKVHSNGW